MQNLLRPRVARAGTTTSVAAFCERRLFSPARVQQDSPADAGQQNLVITDHRYSTAGERSRAREGGENKIQTHKTGSHNQPRRAVDCAPYLNSACSYLCVEVADACGHASLPTQQNFLTGT